MELNNTFYRLPAEEQFERWAAATPPGFRFAVKTPRSITQFGRLDEIATFCERVRALADRLGPILVRLPDARPRDDGFVRLLLDSFDPDLQIALDLRDASWDGVEPLLSEWGAARVGALGESAAFSYLRLRQPPYDEPALRSLADELRGPLRRGGTVYCYFKHEDDPSGPRYAERLLSLVSDDASLPGSR